MTVPKPEALPFRPILVAGAGRSGTSWLGKLLDASPWVLYRHEPDNVERLPWFRGVPSRIEPGDDAPGARAAFREGMRRCAERHARHFVRPPRFPKRFLRDEVMAAVELGLRAAARVQTRRSPEVRLPRVAWRGDRSRVRLVVKSVTSNLRLAWLRRQFPELRVVLIVRHPGGYLSSWQRGVRTAGFRGFGDRTRLDPTVLPLRRPEHAPLLARYEEGTPFDRELVYWIVANETPLLELADDDAVLPVVYEELCREPEKVVEAIYAHCGLEPDEQARAFVRQSVSRHEEGYHDVFKDPARVAWAWRDELPAADIDRVEAWLAQTSLRGLWAGFP